MSFNGDERVRPNQRVLNIAATVVIVMVFAFIAALLATATWWLFSFIING